MNNYVLIKLYLKFPSIQLMKIFSWCWCILRHLIQTSRSRTSMSWFVTSWLFKTR